MQANDLLVLDDSELRELTQEGGQWLVHLSAAVVRLHGHPEAEAWGHAQGLVLVGEAPDQATHAGPDEAILRHAMGRIRHGRLCTAGQRHARWALGQVWTGDLRLELSLAWGGHDQDIVLPLRRLQVIGWPQGRWTASLAC